MSSLVLFSILIALMLTGMPISISLGLTVSIRAMRMLKRTSELINTPPCDRLQALRPVLR